MKFYCVAIQHNKPSIDLLKKACDERSIEFVMVDAENFDFASIPHSDPDALLYRAAATKTARNVELLHLQPTTTTFYDNYLRSISYIDNVVHASIIHQQTGVSIPRTVFTLPENKEKAAKVAEYLGGFPLIIKAAGGSHGVGVMKVDSLSSFYSVIDYLRMQNDQYILRQFINVTYSARLIVLGNEVIDSIKYSAPAGDFRSNEGAVPNVTTAVFPEEVKQTAIRATKVLGLEFGGVDVLIDDNGNHYVSEVNFPCFFPRCQNLSGVDIAGKMIEYLVQKKNSSVQT